MAIHGEALDERVFVFGYDVGGDRIGVLLADIAQLQAGIARQGERALEIILHVID